MSEPLPSDRIESMPTPQSQGGQQCKTCSNPAWKEEVRKCFEKTVDKPEWKLETILYGLLKPWGYTLSRNALKHHMVRHEPELWEKWSERRP